MPDTFSAWYIILQIHNFTLTDNALPGWWSVYQASFICCDVSIGNILIVKQPFESKKKFSLNVEELLQDCWNAGSESMEVTHSLDGGHPPLQHLPPGSWKM